MKNNDAKLTKQFYVYTLANPGGEIFYIGKGSGDRVYNHLYEARLGTCICRKCETIQRIWARRQEVKINYVFETNSQREALQHEMKLIQEFHDHSKLCNKNGIPSERQKKIKRKYSFIQKQEAERRLPFIRQEWKTARQQHWDDKAAKLADEITKLEGVVEKWWEEANS